MSGADPIQGRELIYQLYQHNRDQLQQKIAGYWTWTADSKKANPLNENPPRWVHPAVEREAQNAKLRLIAKELFPDPSEQSHVIALFEEKMKPTWKMMKDMKFYCRVTKFFDKILKNELLDIDGKKAHHTDKQIKKLITAREQVMQELAALPKPINFKTFLKEKALSLDILKEKANDWAGRKNRADYNLAGQRFQTLLRHLNVPSDLTAEKMQSALENFNQEPQIPIKILENTTLGNFVQEVKKVAHDCGVTEFRKNKLLIELERIDQDLAKLQPTKKLTEVTNPISIKNKKAEVSTVNVEEPVNTKQKLPIKEPKIITPSYWKQFKNKMAALWAFLKSLCSCLKRSPKVD